MNRVRERGHEGEKRGRQVHFKGVWSIGMSKTMILPLMFAVHLVYTPTALYCISFPLQKSFRQFTCHLDLGSVTALE